jgi:predicted ATPase
LSETERRVFKRLAVFRSSFPREAAKRITGATLLTLSALVDKSLLQMGADGRYRIHELLRQYAAEHLAQSAEDIAQVYDLHCAYYADLLEQWQPEMKGGQQQAAAQAIAVELENVRAAGQWVGSRLRYFAACVKPILPTSRPTNIASALSRLSTRPRVASADDALSTSHCPMADNLSLLIDPPRKSL